MRARMAGHGRRYLLAATAIAAVAVLLPAFALGHIERASYWPDPAPDTSVKPAAGGSVPAVRKLFSALEKKKPGKTRVVCPNPPSKKVRKNASDKKLSKNKTIKQLNKSIKKARKNGYKLRESQPPLKLKKKKAKKLRAFNLKLLRQCQYKSIQDAVTAAHNNDRIEIMPGLYTEPKSRAKPTNDPACDQYKITNDKNQAGAVSYAYQFHCPNDQNLIAVLGRALTNTPVPQPPSLDRHVIPDAGACIRCNLQIQGTGVSPDDVTVDAGNTASGDGPPIGSVKDVGIRADRADGFVLDNIKVRHAREHDIYVIETDGSHLTRFKAPYAGEYGLLTFVADHSLIENCDAWGAGDSALYPGASADLGEAVPPNQRRYGTELRNCDMRHSTLGYSGTDGNAVWLHNNALYNNSMGFSTDVFTAPGHPGFPRTPTCLRTTTSTRTTSTRTCPSAAPVIARARAGRSRAAPTSSPASRCRSGQECGSRAGTRTWSATTTSTTTGAAGRCSSRSPTRSSATTRTTRWPAAIRQRRCRRPRIATSSTPTRWAWLRTARSSGTAWTSGGTRAASPSTRPSTRGTAGTATRARTARRRASPACPRRAAPPRTTSRPTVPTAHRLAP